MISVTIQSPTAELGTDWDDLVSRAHPNVFMSPAALRAADATGFAKLHVLLAWDDRIEPRRLVGLWAMRERRTWPFWNAVLEALPYDYAFLSSPVIDLDVASDVMPAFLKAIAGARNVPHVILMKSFDTEALSYRPMVDALATLGGRAITIKTENRPTISHDSTEKTSGERRKKLRQCWKKMSALGDTAMVAVTEPEAVAAAVETFLQLEFKSWKGAAGTALLCRDADANFVRRLIVDLAARGQAMVEAIQIDGRTIASQVLLFSGTMAYTWKTAFDPAYAKFSPGVVLVDKLTERLFNSKKINGIDSCSIEGSFMAQIWPDRRAMADLLVSATPHPSIAFWVEAAWQLGRERLKTLRDQIVAKRDAKRLPVTPRDPASVRPAPAILQHDVGKVPDDRILEEVSSPSIAAADVHPTAQRNRACNA